MTTGTSFALCFLFLVAGCAGGRSAYGGGSSVEEAHEASAVSVTPPLAAIPLDEELVYHVSWWGMRVGTVTLKTAAATGHELKELPPFHTEASPKKRIKLTCRARSNWSLETFYPVRFSLTSFVDPEKMVPERFESYLKRRWMLHESVITFDWTGNTSLHRLPERKMVTVPLEPATQDGLSMLYYARTLPFQLGATIPLVITADGKNWPLTGQIVRAGMVSIGKMGEYPAVEGRLELTYPVPFFHGAKARVWFSADDQRIPLMAKIRSRIGPVTVVLIDRKVPPAAD